MIKVRFNPRHNVVLERTLDELMEKVRREQFVDVGTRKVVHERLECINVSRATSGNTDFAI